MWKKILPFFQLKRATLWMHLQEPSTEGKVSHCATNKESIHSCNNHNCSVKTFAPEHNLPVREKKIIGTTSILTWGKSRVLPTDRPFTLDILSSLYREKYMYTKSQRLFPTFLSGAKIFGHVSLSTSCLPSLYVMLDFKTVGFFSNTVSQNRDCFAV